MADPNDPNAFVDRLVRNRLADALDDHAGYVPPGVWRHPELAPDAQRTLPAVENYVPSSAFDVSHRPKHPLDGLLMNIIKGGLRTGRHWLQGDPEVGPDTAAPLGLAGLGAGALPAMARGATARAMDRRPAEGMPASRPTIPAAAQEQFNALTHDRYVPDSYVNGLPSPDASVRAEKYWRALSESAEMGDKAPRGYRLNANPKASNVPGVVLNGLEQKSLTQRLEALPQVPRREVLPSDFPIERGNVGVSGRESWVVRSNPEGPKVPGAHGSVEARIDPEAGAMRIIGSSIPAEQRGQGQGLAMYQRLIDEAHRRGYEVQSDHSVSQHARRIYDALAERGYEVRRNPDAIPSTTNAGLEVGGWHTGNYGTPVYTVWPPRRAYSDPSASLPGAFVPQSREEDARNRLINALADDPLDPYRR